MKIKFTQHSQWRMNQRKIEKQEILDALAFPDKVINSDVHIQLQLQKNDPVTELD